MRKIIENVKLQDVETIVIENDNVSNFIVSEDGKTLSIMSNIKPEIIDANFNELDKRLSDLEATMKMRVLGQISNLTSKIEKLNRKTTAKLLTLNVKKFRKKLRSVKKQI